MKMKKIKFEEFETLFKPIKFYIEERNNVEEGVDKIFPSSYVSVELGGNLLDCYIDLLEKYLNIENEWISWWVFDTDMGKSGTRVEDVKTSKVDDLKTLKDLYNFLTTL
jgi:hypothetical protein